MIVVAIIAILAAIAIPAYQDYAIRAQIGEGYSLATGAKTAIWDFVADKGRFPPGNLSSGLASPASISGSYVSTLTVTNGVIAVAFNGPKANSKIGAGNLILSPVTKAGSILWSCYGDAAMSTKYLPTSCRR